MTIKRVVTAIALAALMGIVLPVATAQAPPCFTFDGQIKTMQCPVSFRPAPVQYYSNAQSGFSQATDNGDRLPSGFFDQQTIDTLRQRAAQNQNQSQNASILSNQNQSVSPAPTTTNITSLEIEAVRSGLNAARQSLDDNDTQALIESINHADGALFEIIVGEGKGPVRDGLTKLSDAIDTIRQSVFNLDNEKAIVDLNAADSQLLLITETLSTPTPTVTEEPQSAENQSEMVPPIPELELGTEPAPAPTQNESEQQEQQMIREDMRNQNQTNTNSSSFEAQTQPLTVAPLPTPEPTITIPLNKTQQELVTIEEIGGLNKTTHEKTTISIIEGNKTTHREITTTEVPLDQ